MAGTKHTAGPWAYGWETQDQHWAIVTDAAGGIVANVNTETGPDAHSAPAMRQMPGEANARLIAAAPDLLAALEEAVKALSRCYDVCDWPADGRTIQDDAIRAGKAAISKAKAEGSSHD